MGCLGLVGAAAFASVEADLPDTLARLRATSTRPGSVSSALWAAANHFIELCLDEARRVWVMPYYFIDAARGDMERNETRLPDRDLA